jgi:hypothetical protein
MIAGQTKFNLKIFQIDKSYYEFKDASDKEIIEIIQNNHEKKLRHKFEDLTLICIAANRGDSIWCFGCC